jgi:hypothetical protein
MNEKTKTDSKDLQGDTPVKENPKKKEAGNVYRLYKKESHKDNKCILVGIEEKQLLEFNKGEVITVSNEQIKIIGCEVNEAGEITRIPYRWLGVEK